MFPVQNAMEKKRPVALGCASHERGVVRTNQICRTKFAPKHYSGEKHGHPNIEGFVSPLKIEAPVAQQWKASTSGLQLNNNYNTGGKNWF